MKPAFKLLCVISLFTSMLFLNSCGKDDDGCKDKDPCESTVPAISTIPAMHYLGHFILDQSNGNGFTIGQTFLNATNWSDYADKVVPQKKYQIAYKEVSCDDRFKNTTFDENKRCGMPDIKCIEILCLKEVPEPGCFGLTFISDKMNDYYSRALSNSFIQNHSLKTTSYFSGCSQDDPIEFKLMLKELPTMGPTGQPIFEAKVMESNELTCNAVFQKSTCFDLSEIRQYFERNNRTVPNEVLINLYEGQEVNQLVYNP